MLGRRCVLVWMLAVGYCALPAGRIWADKKEDSAEATVEAIKKDLYYLASEECEGRGIETQGINKAADYIVAGFKASGLKPAGKDGSYFQPFTVRGTGKLKAPNSLAFHGALSDVTPKLDAGFTVSGLTSTGKVSVPVVFAGYGVTMENDNYDDYKGLDVAGKAVIVLRQTPRLKDATPAPKKSGTNPAQSRRAQFAALAEKIANAEKHKAAAVIFVNDEKTAGADDPLMDFNYARGDSGGSFPIVHVKRAVVDQLLAAQNRTVKEFEADVERDQKPFSFAIKDCKVDIETNVERVDWKVKNIVGYLEGAGPLANETVVIGAHYDHLGRGERGSREPGNKNIHYGADDNGSGSSTILELARRFGGQKDRQGRRLVFMTFSGEERGLLGSAYYCKNPLFPLENTVAMINLDMVGRLRTDKKTGNPKLQIGGVGSAKTFEPLIDKINEHYHFDLQKSKSGVGPSDHQSFYMKKVPVYFFFTGDHPEYHTPADKPNTINYEGMKTIADMVEELAKELLTVKERPVYVAGQTQQLQLMNPSGSVPKINFMPGNYDDDETKGVLVGGVTPGGAAAKGGVKEGDWIISVAGKPVKNIQGYMKAMGGQKAGETIEVIVLRGEEKIPLKVTLQ